MDFSQQLTKYSEPNELMVLLIPELQMETGNDLLENANIHLQELQNRESDAVVNSIVINTTDKVLLNCGGRSKIINRADELSTTSVQSDSLDRGIVMEEMETDMIDALDSL